MRPLFYLVALGTTALTVMACKKPEERAAAPGEDHAEAATAVQTGDAGPAPSATPATPDPGLVPSPPGSPPPPGIPESLNPTPQSGPPPINTPPQ